MLLLLIELYNKKAHVQTKGCKSFRQMIRITQNLVSIVCSGSGRF